MKEAPPQIAGKMRFVQHVLPALESGTYRLELDQEVTIDKALADRFGETVHFAVSGDRFALASSGVDSVFPPDKSQGEYSNCLPHVVLDGRTLPWERSPTLEPPPLGNEKRDVPSWLAVLVFDADEAPPVKAVTLADLIDLPAETISYPELELQFGESRTDPCSAIDVPAALFSKIAPTLAELGLLAHVRSCAEGASGAPELAVVVANRLPAAGGRSVAHLVSLEGCVGLLPPAVAAAKRIRLATLRSWSFESISERRRFADVLEAIKGLGGVGPMLASPVSVPDAGPQDAAVARAMTMGYTAVEHRLRDGGQTASWYRGPLLPYRGARETKPISPAQSADAALRYDPETGLLDASYAAAWQLGRMLGLASREFDAAIVDWKRRVSARCLEELERRFLESRIAPDPATDAPTVRTRRRVGTLADALADADVVARALADAPPIPPLVVSWLDRLRRLHGVPFWYLVPTEAVLGPETLRFFFVDPNWIEALAAGAFSLGSATAGDAAAVAARAAQHPHTDQVLTGFLLRSQAVRDWPGLQASPYAAGAPLPLLRVERIAVDVLLCLVDGELDRVDVHEPPEGLHFGLLPGEPPTDPTLFSKPLRDPETAAHADVPAIAPIPYRAVSDAGPGGRTIEIDRLAETIASRLKCTITAAEFALELVEGVGLVSFQATPR